MSLNVKNPETVRLVAALASRLNTTQVQAINEAVTARLEELDQSASPGQPSVDSVLTAIWDAQSAGDAQAVRQRQARLYDDAGLPA